MAASPSNEASDQASLEDLARLLDPCDHVTVLITGNGRPPRLAIAHRRLPLAEDVYADARYYWWGYAERIARSQTRPPLPERSPAACARSRGPSMADPGTGPGRLDYDPGPDPSGRTAGESGGAVTGPRTARWSACRPDRVVITGPDGAVQATCPVPCVRGRPGPLLLAATGWAHYPCREWEEDPPGQWSVPVFRHGPARTRTLG